MGVYNAQCVLCSVRCPCIQNDPESTTIKRRGIFREEGVDLEACLGGKSRKRQKMYFCAHSKKLGQIYVQWDTKTDKRLEIVFAEKVGQKEPQSKGNMVADFPAIIVAQTRRRRRYVWSVLFFRLAMLFFCRWTHKC